MNAAHLIREARLRAGLTQAELAARAGTTQSALARLERGRSSPSLERVGALVRASGLELRVAIAPPDPPQPTTGLAPADPVTPLLEPIVASGARFVVTGRLAAALRGARLGFEVPAITPDDGHSNLEGLCHALEVLGARVRTVDGSLPLVRTPEALLSRTRWELVSSLGPLDVVFTPPGTRGFRDLVRDATPVRVGGLELPTASLRDAVRELEAASDDPAMLHELRKLVSVEATADRG